jgi:hypothetical protein
MNFLLRRRSLAGARTLLGWLLAAGPVLGAPTASEKAAASALFDEGTNLMSKQSFAAACAKFEASSAIEPGLGVKLWLADCYDRVGRTASAWALFSEAAAVAQSSGQGERERLASARAADLEKRLSRLELAVPEQGLPAGYSVTLDGALIPAGSVGSALPVDPGAHVVVVRAPGYKPRTLEQHVPAGPSSVKLDVPPLEVAPPEPTRSAEGRLGDKQPAKRAATPGSTQRVLGYSAGALGLLSLAGGGFLGYRAYALKQDSLNECLVSEPNACNERGASLREQAQNYGNVATATVIAGGALAATGLVLLLAAPSGETQEVHVGGNFLTNGGSLFVGGSL